ncbi:SGNH/GDSL hydrolase family protein [Chryseobacterium koreense]|uniref:G-D-S-L family lipolytic protein n=1 Tax=Chryseobacterium koreense CCUG 49689 TaxID=1304281 RepID=A0A0J7IZY2_9FLAO|nr:SGNH/GDSL hydrolase family protein [Chryseobacterium koreense]KMQ71369.1 G-D-S-L family lipolytic protein [Chryseobacterium koreense CCUG 49689]MBB5332205.1 lysophospholipase L1-like esterase [Chryseobacterium koreense]
MKKILISTVAVSALLLTVSCKTDFDRDVSSVVVTSGNADFKNYIALGNSLTAGYRDGTLYSDGQNESYPSMIAKQMQLAGGGAFKQPMMPNNVGGFTNLFNASGGTSFYGKLTLKVVDGALSPVPSAPGADLDNVTAGRPYNNMGVPGARVSHLLAPGYGNPAGLMTTPKTANPYFVRFASSTTTSVIADFIQQQPTFFSLWIGSNDALLYALAGGDSTIEPLTPPTEFATYYNLLISQIATTNAKGVIANIPSVTSIPSLTTIPYNPLTVAVLGQGSVEAGNANIDALNAQLYGPLNQILTTLGAGDRIKPLSKTAANPLLLKDESIADLGAQITLVAANSGNPTLVALAPYLGATYGQARQAKAGDLVPLTTKSAIGSNATLPPTVPTSLAARGIAYPFEDKYVLTSTEVAEVNSAITAYNQTIKAAADAKGYAFVDANAKMVQLNATSGIQFDGVKYTATFVTGGSFSLDGVHPTGRGYAILANEFIKAINNKYGSTLPFVNVNTYSGVTFP